MNEDDWFAVDLETREFEQIVLGLSYAKCGGVDDSKVLALKENIPSLWKKMNESKHSEAFHRLWKSAMRMVHNKLDGNAMNEVVELWDLISMTEGLVSHVNSKDADIERLTTELLKVTTELNEMKRAALLQQIAINIELQKKIFALENMSDKGRSEYQDEDGFDDFEKIINTPISNFPKAMEKRQEGCI